MKTYTRQELHELNKWIAEHVMGWEKRKRGGTWDHETLVWWGSGLCPDATVSDYRPTTDPAAAMQVWRRCLEWAREFGYELSMELDMECRTHINGFHPTLKRLLVIHPSMETCICLFGKEIFSK